MAVSDDKFSIQYFNLSGKSVSPDQANFKRAVVQIKIDELCESDDQPYAKAEVVSSEELKKWLSVIEAAHPKQSSFEVVVKALPLLLPRVCIKDDEACKTPEENMQLAGLRAARDARLLRGEPAQNNLSANKFGTFTSLNNLPLPAPDSAYESPEMSGATTPVKHEDSRSFSYCDQPASERPGAAPGGAI